MASQAQESDDLNKFSEQTTFHGFLYANHAKTFCERLAWVLVLVFAFVFLVSEVVTISMEFYNEPVLTRISIMELNTFPHIMVCPPYFFSKEKFLQHNLTKDEYLRLQSIFFGHFLPMPYPPINLLTSEANINATMNEIARGEQLAGLIQSLSLSPDEVLKNIKIMRYWVHPNISRKLQSTIFGSCYKVIVHNKFSKMGTDLARIQISIPRETPPFNISFLTGSYMMVYLGSSGTGAYPVGPIRLNMGRTYRIKMKVFRIKKVATKKHPCANKDLHEQAECGRALGEKECKKAGFRPLYYPTVPQTLDSVSSMYHVKSSCFFTPAMQKFFDEASIVCPEPCQRTFYEVALSVQKTLDPTERLTTITVHYTNALNNWNIEEHFVLSAGNFIGTFGGQLSLWSGASMITLMHAMVYWFFRYCGKKRGQVKEITWIT